MKYLMAFLAVGFSLSLAGVAAQTNPGSVHLDGGMKVYATEHGKTFHLSNKCMSLHNAKPENIHETTAAEAMKHDLKLCSICEHRAMGAHKASKNDWLK